jgi:alpha-L-rhamnosidase
MCHDIGVIRMITSMHEPTVRRVVLGQEPFLEYQFAHGLWRRYHWPAFWIAPQGSLETPIVFAMRCQFQAEADHAPIRVHVSADERFELYLDGQLIARGPERGDPNNWFFQTYDIANLSPGEHLLTARVWAMGEAAPMAQLSEGPAFLLAAEGDWGERLSTGVASWQSRRIDGVEVRQQHQIPLDGYTGRKLRVDAQQFPFGFENDRSTDAVWSAARIRHRATTSHPVDRHSRRTLRPAMLPDMLRRGVVGVRCVFAEVLETEVDLPTRPCAGERNDSELVRSTQAWLNGDSPLLVEKGTRVRAILDLGDYYCAYPTLTTSGGKQAAIELGWAESLFLDTQGHQKGHRDQVVGKYFRGGADVFVPDGEPNRRFTTLWWQAGRYLQLDVHSSHESLTIHDLTLEETRYPLDVLRLPTSSDERLSRAITLSKRSLEMCLHETFMDCPYYEQLAYIGDTRVQALALMSISNDDRPVRKAIELFDASRLPSGWTFSRYPSRAMQTIPTFSMLWIGMVHDFLRIRGDEAFVRARMPGVRAVIDACLKHVSDGLLMNPPGWNFIDWSAGFEDGVPRCGIAGPSASINWLFVLTLRWWSELEDRVGEPELHVRARRWQTLMELAVDRAFWSESRGAWAENLSQDHFTEHAQALAILAGADRERCARSISTLIEPDPMFAATTIYFTHYVFEAMELMGRSDAADQRLQLWRSLSDLGLRCLPEQPEPTRSDCHAWGAHVLLHVAGR